MGDAVSDDQLKNQKLNKVTPKEGSGIDPEALKAYSKIYNDNGGDLKKIEAQLKLKFKPGAKVKDAEDFAKQMLSGYLLAE